MLATFLMLFFTACTFSITMVNTEGNASDIVDETDSASANATIEKPKMM